MDIHHRSRRVAPAPPRNPPPPYNVAAPTTAIPSPTLAESEPESEGLRLVIAIDYGTTYTGVAITTPVGSRADLDQIQVIQDWGPRMGNHDKIPSVKSYSLRTSQQERQWGTDLSPQAIAMVHTKLQLDVNEPSSELDFILHALDGMRDLDIQYIIRSSERYGEEAYPHLGPEEIVTDYLTNVFDCVLDRLVTDFSRAWTLTIPVDIVVTIPAHWTYRAKNSTFRAIREAGFNQKTFPQLRDVLLISEPEAAAIYTARSEREERALEKDDYFILCDAGGGTVDVVAYTVRQLQPTFEIERATRPTGAKCGSIFVNIAFKEWLRDMIGEENYLELDQAPTDSKIGSHHEEGERMRSLMKDFEMHKKAFSRGSEDVHFYLPEPLDNLNIEGVSGGELTIPKKIMESFFKMRADRIVQLIIGQQRQIAGRRIQNVFLVGGFAESPYLQEVIKDSLSRREIDLWVPSESWTAVVRGAAVFGVEKSSNKTISKMTACNRSYGVVVQVPFTNVTHDLEDLDTDVISNKPIAKDQLTWLIKKDDLILSDEIQRASTIFTKKVVQKKHAQGTIPIYVYDGRRDRIPTRLASAAKESKLKKIHTLNYDLKDISLKEFSRSKPEGRGSSYYTVPLSLTIRLESGKIHLLLNLRDAKGPVLDGAVVNEPPIDA